jgi:integrase
MKNERLIDVNFIKDIPKVDSEVVNNKAFSVEDLKRLKTEMELSDPYLIPFFSFILFPLLRPREICRIQVKDIDIKSGFLSVETKTQILSVRRIIDKLKPIIKKMNLENEPGSFYLFTNKDQPAEWNIPLKSKVDHFGKRFRNIKEKLGYGREYGLYSGRHTAIMDLYNSLRSQGLGEMEALLKLMPYTQHKSIPGIKAYIKRHQNTIPPDHSDIFTIDF